MEEQYEAGIRRIENWFEEELKQKEQEEENEEKLMEIRGERTNV